MFARSQKYELKSKKNINLEIVFYDTQIVLISVLWGRNLLWDGSSSELCANKKIMWLWWVPSCSCTNSNKWVNKMFAGKNLENFLDAALHEYDCICFCLLGTQLHQVDTPWILSWTLAYLFGMNIPLEYHCEEQTRMLEQPCGKRLCPPVLY